MQKLIHICFYTFRISQLAMCSKKRENRSHREELNHGRKLPRLLPFRPFVYLSTLFLTVPTFIRCTAIIFKHILLCDLSTTHTLSQITLYFRVFLISGTFGTKVFEHKKESGIIAAGQKELGSLSEALPHVSILQTVCSFSS